MEEVFLSTCPWCGGEGKEKSDLGDELLNEPCFMCKGTGSVVAEKIAHGEDPFTVWLRGDSRSAP